MARLSAKNADFMFATKAIEDELNSIEMSVDNTLIEVTCFDNPAPEFVEGKPSARFSISGAADLAASQGDAAIFGKIGVGAGDVHYKPTGAGPSSGNPDYTGSARVKSHRIRAGVGEPVTYNTELQVTGVLDRDVTP